jgi:membrane protease YdiL (CAAX protease family)
MTLRPEKSLRPLALFLAAFYLVWALRAVWLIQVDEAIVSPLGRAVFSQVTKFCLWVLPAVMYARLHLRESPGRYLGWLAIPTGKQWGLALGATAGFLGLTVVFETTAGGKIWTPAAAAQFLAWPAAISLLVSPLLEETFFRGLVLHELLGHFPPIKANLFSSLLFVGVHLPYWLSHKVPVGAMIAHSAGIFAFSLLAGWLFARDKSIWPPTLAHIANNLLATLLVMK